MGLSLLVKVKVDALALLDVLHKKPLKVVAVWHVEHAKPVFFIVEESALVDAGLRLERPRAMPHALLPLAGVVVAVWVVVDAAAVRVIVAPLPSVPLAQLALHANPQSASASALARLPVANVPSAVRRLERALAMMEVILPVAKVLPCPRKVGLAGQFLGKEDCSARAVLARHQLSRRDVHVVGLHGLHAA